MIKAAQGGMAEVAMGNMAASKATNAAVKAFGSRMVTDHSKANDELKQLATTKGLALPTDPGGEYRKTADALSKNNGADFDKAYIHDMIEDHGKDVNDFQKEAGNGKDADLRSWASKTLPTLQEHLRMARDAQAKIK
ncbi:MAG: hypothetical protein NVSMB68_04400 [Thermoanaerobaculia bacterium]